MSDLLIWTIATGVGSLVALKLGQFLIRLRSRPLPKEKENEMKQDPVDYDDSEEESEVTEEKVQE